MAARAALVFTNLRAIDPYVWSLPAASIIPPAYYPEVSAHAPISEYGFIYYRALYYKSPNSDYPYVCLVKHPNSELPLVQCCDEIGYRHFLAQYRGGAYDKYEIVPKIAAGFNDRRSEL